MAPTKAVESVLTTLPITELVIDHNIRKQVTIDKEFAASIKADGVLQPILVEKRDDGTYEVLDGQRRVLATVDAKRDTVPAIIVGPAEADAERIIKQVTLNDRRAPLTDADRMGAAHQLSLFGVTADQIAKRLSIPKARIETALAVAGSEKATAAIVEHQLTLEQAHVFAEFEEDDAAGAALVEAVQSGRFDHAAERLREERDIAAAYAAAAATLEAEGWRVVPMPSWEDKTTLRLTSLYTDEKSTKYVSEKAHVDCPGRAMALQVYTRWDHQKQKNTLQEGQAEVCTDWAANGHFTYQSGSGSGSSGGGLTDAEKAERVKTRENNKLWVPSTPVRITFIKELLQRKELPAGWEEFVAQFVARSYSEDNHSFAMKLLDTDLRGEEWLKANPKGGAQFLIAMALASIEGLRDFDKSGWRTTGAQLHIAQLSKWGYPMSELEELVAKGKS